MAQEGQEVQELSRSTDALLYVSLVQQLSASLQNEDQLLQQLQLIRSTTANTHPHYTSAANLLNIFLVFTYPETVPNDLVTEIAEYIISGRNIGGISEDDRVLELRAAPIDNETSLIQTADDLLDETTAQARLLSFEYDQSLPNNLNLLRFIQAKTLKLSSFYNDLKDIDSFYKNVDFAEFQEWNLGVLDPYRYYWSKFARANPVDSSDLNACLSSPFEVQFQILVAPIDSGHVKTLEPWLSHTIVPLLKYNKFNLEPLSKWMFTEFQGSLLSKFGLWNIAITLLLSQQQQKQIPSAEMSGILNKYLTACYYYALRRSESGLSSVELTKLYDTMGATLSAISNQRALPSPAIASLDLNSSATTYDSFDEFSSANNPLSPLFEPRNAPFLRDAVTTCQRLYPINKLTLKEYLEFKFNPSDSMLQKEVSKITSSINSSNYEQLLRSVDVFEDVFVSREKKAKIDYVILERLLMANLFDQIDNLIDGEKKLNLPVGQIYELVSDKLWDSFNFASNINDKIGHLHEAKRCLELLEKLTMNDGDVQLAKDERGQIVKLKHLFKAMAAMKNFKIVAEKNKPFTPRQLLQFSGSASRSQISQIDQIDGKSCFQLLNIILEQNPKSYLAFEKLFRILNDLLLYFEGDDDDAHDQHEASFYFNKLKTACIESALVDNNFAFAYTQSVELFEHFTRSHLVPAGEFWLTFYQVGKFVSPDWIDAAAPQHEMLDIWIKQRQILSLTLEKIDCGEHVRVILDQWQRLNLSVERQSRESDVEKAKLFAAGGAGGGINEGDVSSRTQEIITDATKTSNHAGEKISNLLVSGLGWAIGAHK
ncbi:uncharacterized protein LODBEIA_P18710 [Lodderomyces beijingensis]|uniref:Sec39 domain-containing protein n=1 Tax=Lodderomyces beijingensis TaxID=1775926 RepID=A0ABP0ZHJ5_9ASCO